MVITVISPQTQVQNVNPSSPVNAPPAAVSLMPEVDQLQYSGDPGAELAALVTKTGTQERNAARAMRDRAMDAEERADEAEVQDMHDKADLQRIQGIVDCALQIGEGLANLGAGLESAHGASERAEQSAENADIQQNGSSYSSDHVQALQSSANALGNGAAKSDGSATWLKGAGAGLGAAEKATDGFFNGAITDKDADAKMHEASATAFKQMADDAHDSERDASDLMSKAVDFYKEYVDTKAQSAMAAIRRA